MRDVSVYVIDDAEEVRDSLAVLLATAGYRAQTFASALDFLSVVRPGWHGCVVADVRMPAMNGIELVKELKLRALALPVIIMTAHSDVPVAVAALKAGAVDFIEKPFRDEVLLKSLRAARSLARDRQADADGSEASSGLSVLSPREREVALLLVSGLANKVVAARLGISVRTVEVHRANIMQKTASRALPDLVRLIGSHDTSE
ncbi:response regulator [Hyphomicrobium sp. CS1BSMeth3]|uniref:response regulator transcription factor n=1 Tax=Hyphomicrobium sp. CS1BSMeth3 TaxID=1892844 RepID=UPI000931472E|nr:response regulator [Hyphomicrobium sp. CS1BSMeth3]